MIFVHAATAVAAALAAFTGAIVYLAYRLLKK